MPVFISGLLDLNSLVAPFWWRSLNGSQSLIRFAAQSKQHILIAPVRKVKRDL
jgi:hypothetical protein